MKTAGPEMACGRARGLGGGVVVALSLAASAGLLGCGRGENPPEGKGAQGATELEALRWENRLLALELELASRGSPYFLLDLEAHKLVLKSHGAILREYPLQEVLVRSRRLGGGRLRLWASLDTVWEGARVLPAVRRPRVIIRADTVTPPDPSGAVNYLPPTPEEAVPTPEAFRVRFQGGRGLLLVRGEETPPPSPSPQGFPGPSVPVPSAGKASGEIRRPGPLTRVSQWFRREPWRTDAISIRLALAPSDLGALYRSFPGGAALLVVSGRPEGRR